MENLNSFTEITTESWGSRIIGSIKSVLFGLLLFIASFIVLWWNEGRAVKTSQGLDEGASQVVSADANLLDENNDGKLVHISGKVISDEILKDEEFDFEVNALKLRRNIEMYQWIEETEQTKEKETGGSEKTITTYNYKKEWQNTVVNSGDFKIPEGHVNPSAFPYAEYNQLVKNATIGAYSLPMSLLHEIDNYSSYAIKKVDTTKIKNASLLNEGGANISEGITVKQKIYIGEGTNSAPQIGDVKVSFEVVNSGDEYSLVAQQIDNTFEKFNTSTGTNIEMISLGVISAENMFEAAHKSNTITTWVLRFVGFLMMFIGLTLVFKPLVILADVLPMLGSLLGMGLSLFSGIISFSLSFITIAIAWVFFRPVLGITLLAVGIGTIIFFFIKASQKRKLATMKS